MSNAERSKSDLGGLLGEREESLQRELMLIKNEVI
jgi:hypothetical protein